MHGVGVVRRDRGYLFLAGSGGGKSALSAICDERRIPVLGDEWQVVLEKSGAYYLRPFVRQAGIAPPRLAVGPATRLKRAFFLEKARDPKAEALQPMRATAHCLKRHLLWAFEVARPAERSLMLDRLICLFLAVPAYVLHFAKDNRFWETIDKLDEREEAGLAAT